MENSNTDRSGGFITQDLLPGFDTNLRDLHEYMNDFDADQRKENFQELQIIWEEQRQTD